MRTVILAGGKGIRLAPLTEVIPKPLVPIGGMPILEIIIRQLQAQGFYRVTLAVGYLARLIGAYFQDGAKWGVEIDYSFELEPKGTAGPLAQIEKLDETFLVLNGDVLTNLDYNALVQFHKAQGGIATISAFRRQVKLDLGVIITDGCYQIKDYVEKPTHSHLVSMGVYIFEPEVRNFITPMAYLDFPDLVKLLLREGHPVHYFPFDGFWLDIGRHEDYAQAAAEFECLNKELKFLPKNNQATTPHEPGRNRTPNSN